MLSGFVPCEARPVDRGARGVNSDGTGSEPRFCRICPGVSSDVAVNLLTAPQQAETPTCPLPARQGGRKGDMALPVLVPVTTQATERMEAGIFMGLSFKASDDDKDRKEICPGGGGTRGRRESPVPFPGDESMHTSDSFHWPEGQEAQRGWPASPRSHS